MYNSYQNSNNFLKSKTSNYIPQHQQIIQHNDFPIQNKQNYSYQLNKSNNSRQLNKSNNSCMIKDKSGLFASKSVSMLMTDSKYKNNLPLNQDNYLIDQRSRVSKKSMLKSYKNNPVLKVLTQSDLTENYDSDHIFSDQEQNYDRKPNKSHFSNHSKKPQQSNQNKKSVQQYKVSNKYQPNKMQVIPAESFQSQQSEYIQVPPFTFIPSQKLQIRCFSYNKKPHTSLSDIILIIPHNLTVLKFVKKLSITNCFLRNLQGIEHFQFLQEVNLRKNQLRQVQQLYRIQNKQRICSINIIGNDIEHFHLARYQNLSQVFPNLLDLNDKNYSLLKRKEKGDMRKILKKASKIEYDLRNTLKKQTKKTDKAMIRFNPALVMDQQTSRSNQTRIQQMIDNRMTQRDQYSYENDGTYSNRDGSMSKKLISQMKSPTGNNYSAASFNKKKQIDEDNQVYQIQPSNLNPNSYSLGQSSRQKQFSKTINKNGTLKDISLGNLQNVPITKSVKYQQKSPAKYNNQYVNKQNIDINNVNEIPLQAVSMGKNFLEIRTEGLDNQSQLTTHLYQPTATFAMQKQRQQQCNLQNKQFMFKNKKSLNNKPKVKIQISDQQQIFEEYQNDEDENDMNWSRISKISEIPTKRNSNNRRSVSNMNQKNDQRSRYENNENTSQRSFMTGNQYNPIYQNNSYMGISQLMSQYRPNESMDEDCLLKQPNDGVIQQRMVITTALYLKDLLKKTFYAFHKQCMKTKNLPQRKQFF